jgi:hypothetical protein
MAIEGFADNSKIVAGFVNGYKDKMALQPP